MLPESNVGKSNEGEVIAVGSGMHAKDGTLIPPTVKVGDKVLLPEYGGVPLKIDNEEVYLFRNEDILAKFSK